MLSHYPHAIGQIYTWILCRLVSHDQIGQSNWCLHLYIDDLDLHTRSTRWSRSRLHERQCVSLSRNKVLPKDLYRWVTQTQTLVVNGPLKSKQQLKYLRPCEMSSHSLLPTSITVNRPQNSLPGFHTSLSCTLLHYGSISFTLPVL